MKKNFLIPIIVFAGIAAIVAFRYANNSANDGTVAGARAETVTVYYSPTCGCCANYAKYLKKEGFEVDAVLTNDVGEIKTEYEIPNHLGSCHTSIVGGYAVEGHVPVEVIERLLEDQPDIAGIALAAMPSGSPGMPGRKVGPFQIHAVSHDGNDDGIYLEY